MGTAERSLQRVLHPPRLSFDAPARLAARNAAGKFAGTFTIADDCPLVLRTAKRSRGVVTVGQYVSCAIV